MRCWGLPAGACEELSLRTGGETADTCCKVSVGKCVYWFIWSTLRNGARAVWKVRPEERESKKACFQNC